MKIRTKFTLIFMILALLPLATIGAISYKNEHDIIKKNQGANFHQRANDVVNKVDRALYRVHQSVQTWAELELMQEVITDDIDGKISSFLMGLNKKQSHFASIDVLNSEGVVVASSNPDLIGVDLSGGNAFINTIGGNTNVEDVALDIFSDFWVVTFSSCINAEFDKNKVVGILCAKWKADELFNVMQYKKVTTKELNYASLMYSRIKLLRNDGMLIAGIEINKDGIFKRNLIESGLTSALLASQKKGGYIIEKDRDKEYIIGYDYSVGYRDFTGLGWCALVLQSTEIAFAPIQRLKIIVIGMGVVVALVVIVIAIILSRKMSSPILEISKVAEMVANGNFEGKINNPSNDEIGSLAKTFNKMTNDLKIQRAMLVEKDYIDNIIKSMNETLIVVNPDAKIKMVNQAALNLLGYKKEELINVNINKIFTEETLVTDLKKIRFPSGIEKIYKAKDGRKIPVLFSSSVMRDKEGNIHGIVCVAQDITERRQTEIAIRESMLKYRSLMHLANDSIFTVNVRTGIIVDVNNKTEELLKMPAKEIIGKHHTKLYPKDVFARYNRFFEDLLQDGSGVLGILENISVYNKNCQEIPVEISASVIDINGQLFVQEILKDITMRKRMENELRSTKDQLQKIIDNTTAVVYLKDIAGRYILINKRYEELFHVKKDKIIGNTDYDIFPKETADVFMKYDDDVLRANKPLEIEEVVPQDDGLHTYISLKFPLRDTFNAQYGVCCISTDITERKKREKKILEIEEKERNRIGRDLHDSIGQLLTGIFLNVQVLQKKLKKKSLNQEAEQAGEVVELVNNTIKQTRMLVKGLSPLGEDENNLFKMLEELSYNVKKIYGLACSFSCDQNINQDIIINNFSVTTNLYRIAQEAINNVIKHASAKEIRMEMFVEDGKVALEISDDGIGIMDKPFRNNGMGLHTMQYRANVIGAKLDIHRGGEVGTIVRCVFKSDND